MEAWYFPYLHVFNTPQWDQTLKDRRKIDLMTLNVKLTLREGVSWFGIDVKKKLRKNE